MANLPDTIYHTKMQKISLRLGVLARDKKNEIQ